MEKKQKEQAKQTRELQDHVEHLQRENDRLWAQVEKRHNLGEEDVQDNGQAKQLAIHDKGKNSLVPNDVDTPTNDELSSGSLLNLSPTKNNRARSHQRHSHRPAFRNTDNGLLHRAKRETVRAQSQPNATPKNAYALPAGVVPIMQLVYPAFSTAPTLYLPHVAMIQSPHDMLSSPLG